MAVRAKTEFGGHSMTAPLRRVMVRKPAIPMHADDWIAFGYTHPIDQDATERQHDAFRRRDAEILGMALRPGDEQPLPRSG